MGRGRIPLEQQQFSALAVRHGAARQHGRRGREPPGTAQDQRRSGRAVASANPAWGGVLVSTEAITKAATQMLFVSPQIAHSYAHSAISNPQISEVCLSANRKSANSSAHSAIANPQIFFVF